MQQTAKLYSFIGKKHPEFILQNKKTQYPPISRSLLAKFCSVFPGLCRRVKCFVTMHYLHIS
ncbi:predicted protein [Neisseria gonorrhoeae PID1]|nr:predicted protein [Neisseria gonorrhoeae PID1]